MKHSLRITLLLICMFFLAQVIGLYVSHAYHPTTVQVLNETSNTFYNKTAYNLPYGGIFNPPENINPQDAVGSIIVALIFAVLLMVMLMKFKAEMFLRLWFFVVVVIGMSLTLNTFFISLNYAAILALIVAIPLAYLKIIKRNLIVHNATELIIYPGIAAVFVPLLTISAATILLIIISLYDVYAVWHTGFMQKMAKYQIEKVRVFTGFFIPYLGLREKAPPIKTMRQKSQSKSSKLSTHVAILGGGDVVFPIILAGVVLNFFGAIPALIISLGATVALAFLFYYAEKGKFYPAMPFISVGCFLALGVVYLIS